MAPESLRDRLQRLHLNGKDLVGATADEMTSWLEETRHVLLEPRLTDHDEVGDLVVFAVMRLRGERQGVPLDQLVTETCLALRAILEQLARDAGQASESVDGADLGHVYRGRTILGKLRFEGQRELPEDLKALRSRLRRFGTVLAVLRGDSGFRSFFDETSRATLIELQARIGQWLRAFPGASEDEGHQLWSDCRAVVALLPRPPTLPDVEERDREQLMRLKQRLAQERPLSRGTIKKFRALRGLDADLDELFERSEDVPQAWQRVLKRYPGDA